MSSFAHVNAHCQCTCSRTIRTGCTPTQTRYSELYCRRHLVGMHSNDQRAIGQQSCIRGVVPEGGPELRLQMRVLCRQLRLFALQRQVLRSVQLPGSRVYCRTPATCRRTRNRHRSCHNLPPSGLLRIGPMLRGFTAFPRAAKTGDIFYAPSSARGLSSAVLMTGQSLLQRDVPQARLMPRTALSSKATAPRPPATSSTPLPLLRRSLLGMDVAQVHACHIWLINQRTITMTRSLTTQPGQVGCLSRWSGVICGTLPAVDVKKKTAENARSLALSQSSIRNRLSRCSRSPPPLCSSATP